MKLKNLELFGFKSFADRTRFEFGDGLTVLVGPNGCGKSNFVDAVKWVLGEQRPTSLRGKEMQDVLFNGTSSRRALGMAEVSVTFDNVSGYLPVDYDEVVVTRRMYRDGGSEFLLNRSACRLRDIRELFMDTGTGVESYSIMEQGKIDALLQAGPKDRRAIFDEASGISKYKSRRRETERRLDKVVANLERLQDVLDLTLKRERSVKIQAGRARRFQALVDELRELRLKLALHRYHGLLAERQGALEKIDGLVEAEREVGEQILRIGTEIRESESTLEGLSGRLRDAQKNLNESESGIVATRERIEYAGKLGLELEERMARDVKLVERADESLESLRVRQEEVATERADAEAALEDGSRELEEAETGCRETRERLAERRRERETSRQDALQAMSRLSGLENRRARLEADSAGIAGRLERLDTRLGETAEEAVQATKRAEEAEAAAAALGSRLEAEAEGQRRREDGVAKMESEIEELRSSMEELDRDTAAARSRREVLVNLQSKREGVSSGARRVLEVAGATLPGVKGMVADYLEVEVEHARAVESLLGDRAEAIVTETLDDALKAIDFLREGSHGRATFLPLDRVEDGAGGAEGGWIDRTSLPVWAQVSADLVRSRNGCGGKLMAALLGDAVVVDGLDGAIELMGASDRRCRIVTGGGDLLEPAGLVSGGEGDGDGGLVSRNAEIRELAGILRNLANSREGLATDRERKSRVLTDLRREREDAQSRLSALREARAKRQSDATRRRAEAERLEESLKLDRQERGTCASESDRLVEALAEVEAERLAARQAEEEVRAAGAELEEAVAEAGRALAEAEEKRTERRIAIARSLERKQAAASRAAAVEQEIREARSAKETAESDHQRCEERRTECEEEAAAARITLEDHTKARETAQRRITGLRREAEAAREEQRTRRDRSETLRTEQSGFQQELQSFRLRENESRLRIEALLERIAEECECDLASRHDEGYEDPDDVDWDALEREAGEKKTRLDRLGHVNLDAIRELEELEDKSRFLQGQKDDLVSSRDTLLRAIREINERSRAQFVETFAAVREGFRTTFRKLFGGGRADVVLEDEDDPLECGIEIVAKPPGKELRTIGLLSGGERTMAAAALMFAFFGARPTPFVILDEVDAALDEANIDRFLGLVREQGELSQFIVITHSRRTMSVADAIYGVTMAESGVSRRMAMKLEEAEEAAREEKIETLGLGV